MKNWSMEVERLQEEKQNEELNKRLALVADEVSELQELEAEFQAAGTELDQCKRALIEVSGRNSPQIEELTLALKELKAAISDIDVDLYLQELVIKNSSLEIAKQQTLCNELTVYKDNGELEFARYIAAKQTLIELERARENEKKKLKILTDRFYKLNAVPDIATLDRRIRELKTETMNAQQRVSDVERNRREMNSEMMFLRSFLAKK
jgi:hypothetical protein